MENKLGWNKSVVILLVFVMLSLGTVVAGNFIMKRDTMVYTDTTLTMEGGHEIPGDDYVFRCMQDNDIGLYLNLKEISYDFRNSNGESNAMIGAGIVADSTWVKRLSVGETTKFSPNYPLEVRGKNSQNITAFFEGAIAVGDIIISPTAIVDRTFYPSAVYNAISKIKLITSDLGASNQLDHKTLPAEAYSVTYKDIIGTLINETTGIPYEVVIGQETIEGRDMGAMISINTKALQEIISKVEALEEDNIYIKSELCKLEGKYGFC